MSSLAVGIDLGTTTSCVAIHRNRKVEIIQNDEGSYVIPSWVGFTDYGVITGHEAKSEAHKYIKNSIYEVKRLMGQRYTDAKVQCDIKRFPYEVVNDHGSPKIKVQFQEKVEEYYPEEISAFILRKLKDLAEACLKMKVSCVVVTVPAYFNDLQRQATKDAAVIAGFQTVNIINEPTAAALAYSYHSKKPYKRNVLVYDFGGGTFDVSIVTVGRGKCEVKATNGDSHLGGTDIDTNLVNFIKKDFNVQFDEELIEDELLLRRVRNRCEKVKEKLSGLRYTAIIELDELCGKNYSRTISKTEFQSLNSDIFEKTMEIVQECLKDSGFDKNGIDEVILVGGSSRIQKVQEMLKEFFGEDKVIKGINPDEAVAYGAAIHAVNLLGEKDEVKDVISLSLGISVNTPDGNPENYLTSVVIPRNTSVPKTSTKRYYNSIDNQKGVSIIVLQGEKSLAKDNVQLGQFVLSNITLGPVGTVGLDVCFSIDAEGILSVTAVEDDTYNANSIQIDVKKSGLMPDQIQKRIEEFEQHSKAQKERTEFRLTKYNLESFCITARDKAEKFKDDTRRNEFVKDCEDISEWLKNISVNDQKELLKRKTAIEEFYKTNTS